MAKVRIYQKPAGIPVNTSVFAVEILQNNVWYTRKVSWETIKGLIAGAESLVFNAGTLTFTTPDGIAHQVLSVDSEVIPNSANPVTGGAVSTALAGKQDTLTFDQVPTDGSTNPVESNGIYDALALKQDTLTFDTTPTDGSTNPVTSQGIYAAISAVTSGIDWKEAVATYADIATTYPNPEDGWTVTTLDDDHTYRYNGTAWVDLFSLITMATAQKDGLMSSTDFSKLSGIEAGATRTIVDDALSTSSMNPVQNKVITGKLNTFLDVNETTFTNPYTKKLVPSGKYTEKLKKLIGASVVWNQLADETQTFSKNFSTATSAYSGSFGNLNKTMDFLANHVYLISAYIERTIATNDGFQVKVGNAVSPAQITINNGESNGYKFEVCKLTADLSASILAYNNYGAKRGFDADDNMAVSKLNVIDITAMFSSIIADYVYTLETQTAGSGIAWLKSYGFFTKDYYAYSANTIQSVSVSGKKNVGKNQLDLAHASLTKPSWYGGGWNDASLNSENGLTLPRTYAGGACGGFTIPATSGDFTLSFRVAASETYRCGIWYTTDGTDVTELKGASAPMTALTENRYYITYTVPSTAQSVLFRPTRNAGTAPYDIYDIMIESGSTPSATFAPYTETTYPLDHTELRGVFRLDTNNNIVADGDEYNADGSGEKKYYFGTIAEITSGKTWTRAETATSGVYRWSCQIVPESKPTASQIDGFLCEGFTNAKADDIYRGQVADKSIGFNSTNLYVIYLRYDSATTQEELLNAVGANAILYELATPTTATLTPYEKLQPIEQGGTEEFIDYGVQSGTRDVAIPAGNETAYGDNENMGKIINYMTA